MQISLLVIFLLFLDRNICVCACVFNVCLIEFNSFPTLSGHTLFPSILLSYSASPDIRRLIFDQSTHLLPLYSSSLHPMPFRFPPLPDVPIIPPRTHPPSPPSITILCLPVQPHAPLPLALATNITCKGKDAGDRMGEGEVFGKTAGRSVPHGNSPSKSLDVMGDSISRTLLLHLPQQ